MTEFTFYHATIDGEDFAEVHIPAWGYYVTTAERLNRTTIEQAMDRMIDAYDGDAPAQERLRALAVSEPGKLAVRVMACDCTPN